MKTSCILYVTCKSPFGHIVNGKMVRITPEQTSKRKKSIIFAVA